MRSLFLAFGAGLVAALALGCGSTSDNPPGSTTTGHGGEGTGGKGTGGTGGDTGSGGQGTGGGPLADPLKGAWRDSFGVPGMGGFGGRVSSLVRGTDGRIYAGGIFSDAGGVAALNVAAWNGAAWEPLGAGLPGFVNALAFGPDGALYAGGWFGTDADPGNHLARWDGTAWTMIAGEVTAKIRAIATQGDHLLVAAESGDIAGLGTAGIARYTPGTGWAAIGEGGADFDVAAVFVTGAETFCIGGVFGSVDNVPAANAACWDGAAWSQFADGLPGPVARFARDENGTFYAAGALTFIVDDTTGDYNAGIAVLNGGKWAPFHGGIDNGFINEVRAIAFASDGDLLIGGTFGAADHAALVPAQNIARYDFQGGGWSELGGGAQNDVGISIGSVVGVNDLLVLDDGTIWVGGLFSSVNGGTLQAANVATLNGSTWKLAVSAGKPTDGLAGLINDLVVDAEGRVVAGGHFTAGGGVAMSNVGRYGKTGWEPLGKGVDDTVRAVLVQRQGDVLVGGDFTHAGAAAAPFVARWNGAAWATIGGGVDGPVTALAEDAEGILYAGGDFAHAGSTAADHIARWDGSKWTALGKGLDGRVTSILATEAGHVIATGLFQNSGSTVLHGLAEWDGTTWKAFGGGFNGADLEYGSRVIKTPGGFAVAGSFTAIDGHPFASLARWDGQQWVGYGAGLSSQSGFVLVSDIAAYGDRLFATGIFDKAGSTGARYVAYWDGAAWHPLGAGLDDLAESLTVGGTSLWIGGGFLQAGGKISTGIAAWDFGP